MVWKWKSFCSMSLLSDLIPLSHCGCLKFMLPPRPFSHIVDGLYSSQSGVSSIAEKNLWRLPLKTWHNLWWMNNYSGLFLFCRKVQLQLLKDLMTKLRKRLILMMMILKVILPLASHNFLFDDLKTMSFFFFFENMNDVGKLCLPSLTKVFFFFF